MNVVLTLQSTCPTFRQRDKLVGKQTTDVHLSDRPGNLG